MDSKVIDKIQIFETEINYIKSPLYKTYLKNIIPLIPNYFYEVGASSTGKYHPTFSNGEGGLLRHTKVAVRIAKEILDNSSLNEGITDREKDIILISLLLHDAMKYGTTKEQYTRFDHPILASKFVKENKFDLPNEDIKLISDLIKTHMGPWTKDYFGNEILESPKTKLEKIVHLCDYLSSKKFLSVNFVNNDIID